MVEQLTLNQLVPGSSPGGATRSKPAIAQRFAGFVVYEQPTGKDGYEKGAPHTLRRSPARPPHLRQRYPPGFVWPRRGFASRSRQVRSAQAQRESNATPHHGCEHAQPTAPSATRLARECQLPPRRRLVLADTRSGRHSIPSLFPKTTGIPWSPSPTMIFTVMKPTQTADRSLRRGRCTVWKRERCPRYSRDDRLPGSRRDQVARPDSSLIKLELKTTRPRSNSAS